MQSSHSTAVLRLALTSAVAISLGAFSASADSTKAAPIKGRYAFRMTPAKSFSADAPGDPGGIGAAPRQDILRVGVFTADGNGNLKGHTIATTDTNNGQTWVVTFDWSGKYVINPDGTGYFSVDTISNMVCTNTAVAHSGNTPHPVAVGGTPLAGNVACPTGASSIEGHEDYAFVFSTPGGKQIEFIQTDNDGGGAKVFLTGTARMQESGPEGEKDKDDRDDQGGR